MLDFAGYLRKCPAFFDKAQYGAGYKLNKSLLPLDSVTDVCYNKQDPGRAFCHAESQIVNRKGRYDTLNLSIMPLEKEHIEEYCEDIIDQRKRGISTHAMLMMKFNPEGTPAVNKAEEQCKIYDQYREILDRAGAKHGVLVQATLGHITVPYEPYPFQPSVSLVTGEDRVVTCCPMDPHF